MIGVLIAVAGLLLLGGAIGLGVFVQMRMTSGPVSQEGPPVAPAPAGRAFRRRYGDVGVEVTPTDVRAWHAEGRGERGLGQVPGGAVDLRLEGSTLRFFYLPDGAHHATRELPLPAGCAQQVAADLAEFLQLPRATQLLDVQVEDLLRDPAAYGDRVVRLRGNWSSGFECSYIGTEIWLEPTPAMEALWSREREPSSRPVAVIGLFRYRDGRRAFGHLGVAPASLVAFEMELLEG